MKKAFCISILVILGVFAFSINNISDRVVSAQQELPPGNWSFSAHPFMGKGYESRPVVVTSVRNDVRGLSVTAVRVRNTSSKPVKAVRFVWYLSNENDHGRILNQGETPTTYVDGGLAVGESKTMKLTIVSFVDIYKPLLRNKELNGDYRVDIAAVEVMFDDQSKWTPNKEVAGRSGGTVIVETASSDKHLAPSPASHH